MQHRLTSDVAVGVKAAAVSFLPRSPVEQRHATGWPRPSSESRPIVWQHEIAILRHLQSHPNVVRINHQLGTAYTALRTSQPRATSKRSSAALCPKGNRRNDVTVSFHVCHRDKLTAARNSGIIITAMCLKLNLE